jgi:predicted TIM-barrel fold metal-dependent hydrolase
MIIDAHSHMFQDEYHNTEPPQKISEVEGIDVGRFVEELDKGDIRYVLTLAQDMTKSWEGYLGSNSLAADLQEKSNGRLLGIAGAKPLDKYDRFNWDNYKDFEYSIKERGLKGLLFTPPYEHFFINDRRAYPFYAKAMELNVPFYVHQAAQYVPPADFTPLEYGRAWLLEHIAIDFQELRILAEHMAFPWTQELLAMMSHAPNVYTDFSALIRRPTLLAWNLVMAKEYGVLDRVMYGTDYVGISVDEYMRQITEEVNWVRGELNPTLERAGWPTLTEGEIDGLLCGNAASFLDLSLDR